MKSMKVRVVLSALALLAIASAALVAQAPAPPPKRVALLVGINEYNRRGFVDLKWAENDVDAVGQELKRIGFDRVVTLKGSSAGTLKATRENIDKQLMALLEGVGKNDVVLVMLSGHGQELPVKKADGTTVRDQFYCPIDAVVNRGETMFSLSRLTDETLHTWGGKNLVLVDACRDGVVDNDKGVARGIQGKVVALPEGTAVLFACASGQRSIELGRLQHGVFTHGVLEALKDFDGSKGPLTWGSLVDRVQNTVAELNPEQEPIAAGVLGRLVLANRTAGAPVMKKADVDRPRPSASNLPPQIGLTAGELRDDNGLKMKFRWCPPGKFRMGSPASEPERRDNEGPVDVTLSQGFWMGQFEVTQSQWQTVMGTSLREQMAKAGQTKLYGEGGDHPIYYVNHTEATEFCSRLTETERRAGRLPSGWIYALPTEAQWEYACRAGTTTATSFGDRLSSREANFDGNSPYNGAAKGPDLEKTSPVGSYRPNAWGLCDMHGNVYEWCQDWYQKELHGGVDPVGSEAASRVCRGGSWSFGGGYCRSANRSADGPSNRDYNVGFRVARVPQ